MGRRSMGTTMVTERKFSTGPKVSIGMPVFNGEDYIEEAVNSLLRQSFCDFELIISDNASTDETFNLCKRLASTDKRIRVVQRSKNNGAIANFGHVLEQARGEYFMWASADDYWDRDWIEKLLACTQENNCVAFGLVRTIDSSGRESPQFSDNRKLNFVGPRIFRRLSYFLSPTLLGKQISIHGLFPREVLDPDDFIRLSSAAQAIDVFFMYNILKTKNIVFAGNTYLSKRVHAKSDGATAGAILPTNTTADRWFKRSLIHKYLEWSSGVEKLLLICVLPICVLKIRVAKIRYIVFRLKSK